MPYFFILIMVTLYFICTYRIHKLFIYIFVVLWLGNLHKQMAEKQTLIKLLTFFVFFMSRENAVSFF